MYDNAKNVLVWLGPEVDDSDLAMDRLGENICDKAFRPGALRTASFPHIRRRRKHTPIQRGHQALPSAVVAARLDYPRDYWGWEVRENVLLHCGNSKKKWEDVYGAISDIWSTYLNRVGIESESSVQGAWWKTLIEATSNHEILGHASDLELEDWLAHLKYFETSESKDKVWIACLLTQHREPVSGLDLQYQQSL